VPQLVKKIIQYRELQNDVYSRLVWELDKPVLYQYAVGEPLKYLVPIDAKLQTDKTEIYKEPLFNKKNHTKIIDSIGQYGLIHIQLLPNTFLKAIFVEPDSVTIDLLLGNKQTLIYEFYNTSPAKTTVITATRTDDAENIYSKIKTNPDDLEYRQYFIRKTLKKADYSKLDEPKATFPEIMTAEQVASYLQLSISTVRNKTSSRELPSIKVAGSTRYLKSVIDGLFKKKKN